MQGSLGAQVNAAGVVGIGFAVHQANDLLELTANLYYNGLSRAANGLHGERREHEGQAGADKQTDQNNRGHNGEVIEGSSSANLLDLLDVRSDQSQSGQSGGAR